MIRLFVALKIPTETREALASLIARLKPKCTAAKWVRPESMHVTLKFIGRTGEENLPALKTALATIHSPQPIDIHLRSLGFFPNEKYPRVFWCGVEISANAAPMTAEINRALEPLGVPLETHAFKPHLTLARLNPDERRPRTHANDQLATIIEAARESATTSFGSMRTSEFHLFESTLKPTGAEYTCLQTFRFAEATS